MCRTSDVYVIVIVIINHVMIMLMNDSCLNATGFYTALQQTKTIEDIRLRPPFRSAPSRFY